MCVPQRAMHDVKGVLQLRGMHGQSPNVMEQWGAMRLLLEDVFEQAEVELKFTMEQVSKCKETPLNT